MPVPVAYGRLCLKIIRKLQCSDAGLSGEISPKHNITSRSLSVCNQYMGGATSSYKIHDLTMLFLFFQYLSMCPITGHFYSYYS